MNEKMKELIAGAVARGWCSPENSHKEMDVVLAMAIGQEVEKLAESIVRECLEIVNRKEYSYHEADPLWETAELIKEHFGVEE